MDVAEDIIIFILGGSYLLTILIVLFTVGYVALLEYFTGQLRDRDIRFRGSWMKGLPILVSL